MKATPYLALLCLALLELATSAQAGELGDLLQATLQHPQVRAAASQTGAAQAQKEAATGRYFGSAALSAGWHQYEDKRVVGAFVPGVPGQPLAAERIGQAGVTYSLPVDVFGVIAASRERTQYDLTAAELLARQQSLLKLHQTVTAYTTLQALLKQREALKFYRQRVEATTQRIRKEVELGRAAGVDARYAESELARLLADEAQLNSVLAQTQADLSEASGSAKLLPAHSEIRVPAWETPGDAALPVQIAQARSESVRAQAAEARQSLLPSVSLDANYFRNTGAGDYRDTWAVGGVISLPLGVTQYRQAEAQRLSAQAAAEQSEAAARDSARQLAALQASYDAAVADSQAMEKEVAQREQVAAVQREMQRLGSQTLENLFRHERDLLEARYRLAQARARAAVTWSAVQVLAGLPTETYIARMDPK
jgi:outer membrane protein TolC